MFSKKACLLFWNEHQQDCAYWDDDDNPRGGRTAQNKVFFLFLHLHPVTARLYNILECGHDVADDFSRHTAELLSTAEFLLLFVFALLDFVN